MATKLSELKLDVDELRSLLQQAQRKKVQDLLSIEIRKIESVIIKETEDKPQAIEKSSTETSSSKCYNVKLNNHAWDQSDKFFKIYVTLKKMHTVPQESVVCKFTDRSFHLRVLNLDNKNHELLVNNLCEEIVPEKSSYKIKTDMIVLFLAKKEPKTWSHMTQVEKRLEETRKSKFAMNEKEDNPEASLMNLMRKMYEDGNDEMKKTIAKSWTESQEKKSDFKM